MKHLSMQEGWFFILFVMLKFPKLKCPQPYVGYNEKPFMNGGVIEIVATLFWENVRMKLTLPKWGLGSLLGLSKF
jgi:hypothetical protein